MPYRQAILASARRNDAVLLARIIHLVPEASNDPRVAAACGKVPSIRSSGWTGPEISWPAFDGPGEVTCSGCRKRWQAGKIIFEQEPC